MFSTPSTQFVKFHRLRASIPSKLGYWRSSVVGGGYGGANILIHWSYARSLMQYVGELHVKAPWASAHCTSRIHLYVCTP